MENKTKEEYKSIEERFNETQAQKGKPLENKKKNVLASTLIIAVFVVIAGSVFALFNGAYKEEEITDEEDTDIEEQIERLELELQQMTKDSNSNSYNSDSAGAYDDIFSDLSWGQFVNQNYTDNWEIEVTNNGGSYIVGSLNIELYDDNDTYIDTVSIYLPSGGLPPNQSFNYEGYMDEDEKERVSKFKVKPDWLSYE
ncbi:hypothetical protein [Lysinibacillus sp. OTC-L20]|uniref:hypothetical protein n=1 Tax=Lysinibacillus sp. OTC-L20 TaxID=3342791 RepID=UPI0035B96ABB